MKKQLTELLNWILPFNKTAKIEGDRVVIEGYLDLSQNKLTSLPESFGNLKVGGDLYLSHNKLTSLPESFGNLKVGGGLSLSHNKLTSLPESFGNLKVGGGLSLYNNSLISLPESFGNLKVGGYLYLSQNKLNSLPESFGNLKVGGHLYLNNNNLTSLPESFGNLKVGGYLNLSNNSLTSLPESFGNLKVGGGLSLSYNKLTSLPESFGNLKVGGNLYLYNNNNLISLPKIVKLESGIFKDYTYLDGILTDKLSLKTIDGKTVIKHSFGYVVSDGTYHAHGKDLRTALLDLHFKTSERDLEGYKNLDLKEKRGLEFLYEIYRNITGSCSMGVERWMNGNKKIINKIEKEGISITELISITKGQYGNARLKEFFV